MVKKIMIKIIGCTRPWTMEKKIIIKIIPSLGCTRPWTIPNGILSPSTARYPSLKIIILKGYYYFKTVSSRRLFKRVLLFFFCSTSTSTSINQSPIFFLFNFNQSLLFTDNIYKMEKNNSNKIK